jgi:hypothetical protein
MVVIIAHVRGDIDEFQKELQVCLLNDANAEYVYVRSKQSEQSEQFILIKHILHFDYTIIEFIYPPRSYQTSNHLEASSNNAPHIILVNYKGDVEKDPKMLTISTISSDSPFVLHTTDGVSGIIKACFQVGAKVPLINQRVMDIIREKFRSPFIDDQRIFPEEYGKLLRTIFC